VNATSSGRKSRWKARLLLLALAAFVSLCIVEIGLRLKGLRPLFVQPEQLQFWAFDPSLGWKHRPGQSGPFRTRSFEVQVSINSRGLRDGEHDYARVPGKRRILVLGDSFAWGYGVEVDQRFSEVLEVELADAEVINAGVSGYGTDQELLWLEREGARYQPDVVLLVLSGNDLPYSVESQVYFVYHKPRFRLDQSGGLIEPELPLPPPSSWDRARLHSFRYSSTARAIDLLWDMCRRAEAAPGVQVRLAKGNEGKKLTLALLSRLRRSSESCGARLLVLTTRIWWDNFCGNYEDFVEQLTKDGFAVFKSEDAPGFDPSTMIIQGDGHWNAAGHRAIALLLHEALSDSNAWTSRSP